MPGKRLFIKGHREHGETLLFAHWEKKDGQNKLP